MIRAHNKRIEPRRIAGFPEPHFFAVPGIFVMGLMVVMVPILPLKFALSVVIVGLIYMVWDTARWYPKWLVRRSMERGKARSKLPLWAARQTKSYLDGFTWYTKIGDHGLIHRGDVVSVAVDWAGIQDRHASESDRWSEIDRRIGLLRLIANEHGLVMENHFIRGHDSSLADKYLAYGETIYGDKPPAIVADIRKQLVEQYRPLARSNRIVTVLSLGAPRVDGFLDRLLPRPGKRNRTAKGLYDQLLAIFKRVSPELPHSRLMNADEYQQLIQRVRAPTAPLRVPEWRHPLADQLVAEKPVIEDRCLRLGNRFYRVLLLQGYPNLGCDWTLGFSEAPHDIHVCQIVIPKDQDKALDKARKDAGYEGDTLSQTRGTEKTLSKLSESAQYRAYVSERDLPVADNAYIITLSGPTPESFEGLENYLRRDVSTREGLIQDDLELQLDLFDVRLPGLGRNTLFAREDHAEVIAAMMPFTTFPQGATETPECLRITTSGQLVAFAPSRLEVPHELVVAQTGGGKDTQFGLKFLETYPLIRYDIVEMGNSYQGIVEAVGGSYCRAREQVINPLATYAEYQSAKALAEAGHGKIDGDFIRAQSDILTPIFKGLNSKGLNRAEEVVVNRILRSLYEAPNNQPAPTLPFILDAFERVEVTSDLQQAARDQLHSDLYEFLQTEVGSAFTENDQFTISPIANAIDFGGFTGELFKFYMTFMVTRLATNAMSRGLRSQIVLNEYRMLLENAGDPIRWITLTIDRMGRKDWVGLTRISQGLKEIRSVDPEALSSIQSRTLLSREDDHQAIGELLQMPPSLVQSWRAFKKPEVMDRLGYREALVQELGDWHKLFLRFPQLHLDLMNTKGSDKKLREQVYMAAKDPYERIKLFRELKAKTSNKERADETKKPTEPLI
ncbi:MAG: hypothetical protein LAT63_16635 [Marinobacter sp.]|nr:hypothetical protein [Marinobacter sp.]